MLRLGKGVGLVGRTHQPRSVLGIPMCVVSMVMDHYWDKWRYIKPTPWEYPPSTPPVPDWPPPPPPITPEEIEEFRKLLERAREYDKRNNEPDCELQEKKDRLLKLADELGIKIDFV